MPDAVPDPGAPEPVAYGAELHGSVSSRLNWLRAGVLGANDGIISIAGLVVGVAAATTDRSAIATSGIAGLVAGAVSMALGEYVSVSTQRDSERALIAKEKDDLRREPEREHDELVRILQFRGLSESTATRVADEFTEHDTLQAHLRIELGIDAEHLANPWAAALSSALSFFAGAMLPLLAILLPATSLRIPVTFAAVLAALTITGIVSAHLGRAPKSIAVVRLVVGGALAMAITFGIGQLLGIAVN